MYTADSAEDFVVGTQTVMRGGVGVTVSESVASLGGWGDALGGLIWSAFGRGREGGGGGRRGGDAEAVAMPLFGYSSAVAFTGQISAGLDIQNSIRSSCPQIVAVGFGVLAFGLLIVI